MLLSLALLYLQLGWEGSWSQPKGSLGRLPRASLEPDATLTPSMSSRRGSAILLQALWL